MKIQGKNIIITGGASGLGEAVARMMVASGARVAILDINQIAGESLAKELGENAVYIATNISITEEIKNAIEFVVNNFGRIDIVVNCAGIVTGTKIASSKGAHDLASFCRVMTINVIGVFDVIRQAAFAMLKNELNDEGGRGVIINTASIAAFDGQMGQVAYAGSKAALVGMTLPMARDLARDGIRVCTIAPGIFDTPMMAGLPEEVRLGLAKSIPFPSRLGNPCEYAMLVQHIAENAMLNGETIRLDGAIRMNIK